MISRPGHRSDYLSLRVLNGTRPPIIVPRSAESWSTQQVVAAAVAYADALAGDEDDRRSLISHAHHAIIGAFPKLRRVALMERMRGVDHYTDAVPIRYAPGWERPIASAGSDDPAPF